MSTAPAAATPALSVAQVRAAENGTVAISSECLYQTEGKWSALNDKLFGQVDNGLDALRYAADRDPDTEYPNYTGGPRTTMRQQVALIADNDDYYETGGGCREDVIRVKEILDGLPR